MLTIGAPHSSTLARHSSTVSLSLIVLTYSRMRPQPVHVRLQACSGSSISTSGNFSAPDNRFVTRYLAMVLVKEIGNRMRESPDKAALGQPRAGLVERLWLGHVSHRNGASRRALVTR